MEFFLRKVYPWLIEVSSVSPVLPFITGLVLLRVRKNSLLFRLLLLHIFFIGAFEVASLLTLYAGTKNNIWLSHVYTPLEFCVEAAIYYYGFKQPLIRRGILATAVAFVLFCIFNSFFLEPITQMNSIARMVESALVITLAVLYFNKIANDLSVTYLDRDPVFLLSSGILIFKAGTTMSYALFNEALSASYDAARICIAITLVLNILYNSGLVLVLKRTSHD